MSSNIDATKPADNVKVDKADTRANMAAAKAEIEALQRETRIPWLIATGILSV